VQPLRLHKAIQITGPEALFLIQRNLSASARRPVVSFDGIGYDVRLLSAKELERFLDDLVRIRFGRGFSIH
jgi:hypothetical protein